MIGVLGATGRVGRHVAAGLAERGIEARALVRRRDPRLPLPAVQTDLSVPATLAPAFGGVERLLLDERTSRRTWQLTGPHPVTFGAIAEHSPTTRLAHALSPAPRKDLIRP